MGQRYSVAFRAEAVRLALTSGLTRKQLAADLSIGFSTLNKWVQQLAMGWTPPRRHRKMPKCRGVNNQRQEEASMKQIMRTPEQ